MPYKITRDTELRHHGILGMKWGDRNGPPYPLDSPSHSLSEVAAGWRKSLKTRKVAKTANKAVKKTTKAVGGGGGGETDEERYKKINEEYDWGGFGDSLSDFDKKFILKATNSSSHAAYEKLLDEYKKLSGSSRDPNEVLMDSITELYLAKHPEMAGKVRATSDLAYEIPGRVVKAAEDAKKQVAIDAQNKKAEEKAKEDKKKVEPETEKEEKEEEKEEEKKSTSKGSSGSSRGSSGSSKGSSKGSSTSEEQEDEEEEAPSEIAQFLNEWAKTSGEKLVKDLSNEKNDVSEVLRKWAKTDGAKLISELTNSKNSKDVAAGLKSWAKGEGGKLISELGKDKSDVQGILQKWASNLGSKFVEDLTYTASISSIANILSSWAESEGDEFVSKLSDKKSKDFSSTIRSWANDVGSTLIDELKDSENVSAISDFMKEWF